MATQLRQWGGVLFLDRDSEWINSDGSREDIDTDRTVAMQSFLEGLGMVPKSTPGRYGSEQREWRQLFNELLPDLGIGSMENLDLLSVTELMEGIFS